MNRCLVGGIAAAALFFGSMGSALADCSYDGLNRWMTVHNKTGTTAFYIYAKPGPSYRWSRALLGANTVPAFRNRSVEFDYCNRACILDIQVVSASRPDGSRRRWYFDRVNVCRRSYLDLY